MANLKDKIAIFPHQPGCYLFRNAEGTVLYVGKAKNLHKRASQYFGHDKRPQLPFLIDEAREIDYIITTTELEALFLESTLIKKYNPKYNINLKDGKTYAFIVMDYSTEIPQIGYGRKTDAATTSLRGGFATKQSRGNTTRLPRRSPPRRVAPRNDEYFGPYSSTLKIKQTLELVRRIFPYCSNEKISPRPCFYYHLHRCPGVCVGKIPLDEYKHTLENIKQFLRGKTSYVKKEIKLMMQKASLEKKFELAARLRDQVQSLEILEQKQAVQFLEKVDWDFWSMAAENNLACVNLLKVREGKLVDNENFIVYGYTDHTDSRDSSLRGASLPAGRQGPRATRQSRGSLDTIQNTLQSFLEQYYSDTSDLPKAVFTQVKLENSTLIEKLISSRFRSPSPNGRGVRGEGKIFISTPKRGKKAKLIILSQLNAKEYLRKTLESNASDIDKLNLALDELQKILKLPARPKRIEGYDISNIQGTNPVGSMVVFVDGKPAKSEYRKFKISIKDTPDDFAMMNEMLARRLARISNSEYGIASKIPNNKLQITNKIQNSKSKTNGSDPSLALSPVPFLSAEALAKEEALNPWPTPDLIVIDGGKGQLKAALTAAKLQITNYKLQTNSKSQIPNPQPVTRQPVNPQLPMIGLAKRIEEIFLPGKKDPIILPNDNPALQLLQRLRDEAHRFAITFHKNLRSKAAVKSELDTIKGIGPKTKKLLKSKFGTLAQIKSANQNELAKIVGPAKTKLLQTQLS